MGCDIHTYAEVRKGDEWRTADSWGVSEWEARDALEKSDEKVFSSRDLYVSSYHSVFENRSYEFFAALNGVRNYDEIPSYFTERGVPEDACESVKAAGARWGRDGHSHCHATLVELKEMREWMKKQVVRAWGAVPLVSLESLKQEGYVFQELPCAGHSQGAFGELGDGPLSSGKKHVFLSNKPLTCYARGIGGRGEIARIEWDVPMMEYAGEDLEEMIANLEMRKRRYYVAKDEDVRVIWWYDN